MTFNKLVDKHKNPWTKLFHLLGFIGIGYGLWMHDWIYLVAGIVLLGIAHIFPCCKGKKKRKRNN